MIPFILMSAQAAVPAEQPAIVITASRVPTDLSDTPSSATVLDAAQIERLGDALASALTRLTPSASVESGGPAGSLSQVRIRGAEGNHTLLFIDGIRANDPAAGDIPRFELLNADIASRIEVVRGPQSALWGSDAIGGVVAVNGVPAPTDGYSGLAEVGSFGFGRAAVTGALVSDRVNLAAAAGWQRASGIDSFNGAGDKDGYRNAAGRLRASWSLAPDLEVGAAAFSLAGSSQFDGFNPNPPFQRTDTLDNNRSRLSAGRLWLSGGNGDHGLSGTLGASLLGSSNRNFVADEEINRTNGGRWTLDGQLQYRFSTGRIDHSAILALDHDRETFHARDSAYFGASDQDRSRTHDAVTAEWRAETSAVVADLALRHDRFSAFADATTLRASALVKAGAGFSAAASYAQGIAQPTFFDLFGFFPGNFTGNPDLKPESSRGYELSLRYRRGPVAASLTGYRQRLRDEIVDVFDPATFIFSTKNRDLASKRSGIEAELAWAPSQSVRLMANYAYLRATEPAASLLGQVREIRRPKHSGSVAIEGGWRRLSYGASVAYVGPRADTNFDVFPAERVRLKSYWLAGGRVAYALSPRLELFARSSNLFNARYQDVFGYRTEGRAVYAGFRLTGT